MFSNFLLQLFDRPLVYEARESGTNSARSRPKYGDGSGSDGGDGRTMRELMKLLSSKNDPESRLVRARDCVVSLILSSIYAGDDALVQVGCYC